MAVASPPIRYTAVDDYDFSAGVRIMVNGARSLRKVSFQPVWANYTSVTVKMQVTNDEITAAASAEWADVAGATTSTSGDLVSVNFTDQELGPYARYAFHVTATLSVSTDTFTMRVIEEPK